MKRKVFLVSLSLAMSLMVWQMVIAKAPSFTGHSGISKLAYFADGDTTKPDSAEVLELTVEPINPRIYSRKYIPPKDPKPQKIAKAKSKSKTKKHPKKMKTAELATETKATPKQ